MNSYFFRKTKENAYRPEMKGHVNIYAGMLKSRGIVENEEVIGKQVISDWEK